ncbi:MAG TPA: hypothetical protein VF242_12505 [Nitrososphaeraceae archaeon]
MPHRFYNMMSTKTKNIVLLAIVSTFILSITSYDTQQQQVFAQEEVITEEEEEEQENEPGLANQSATEDQKIILDDITIPIKSNTQLSLELPDSKITVEPMK